MESASYWAQKVVSLRSRGRGCHLITDEILQQVGSELSRVKVGLCHLFITHTSCSLTLNENYDPDVRKDMEDSLNRLVPENASYRHTMEGRDDMPAHVKSSLMGTSHTIPITNGNLVLGTWQGIYLCEHRNGSRSRQVVITINGTTN